MSCVRVLAVTCCALLALASGCSNDNGVTVSDTATADPPGTYVAIGGSDTVGIGAASPVVEAWPQVFYRTAVDRNTVFVNFGVEGGTVRAALDQQLADVLELRPTLVTVAFNVDDIVARVPVDTYEQRIAELVRALRQDGRARVLVANTPLLEELPEWFSAGSGFPAPADLEGTVAAYNEAIERVVEAEGAELVDLHAAGLAALADGSFASLVSEDGFHPSTEGHVAIAEAFATAL